MSDIAARLGISTVTVSKALANKDGVSVELKNKILRTAEDLGYQRRAPLPPKDRPAGTIGLLLADRLRRPEHSFYWAMYLSVIDTLKEQGRYSMLEIIKGDQEAAGEIPDFITRRQVEGVIVLGRMSLGYLERIRGQGIPLVLLDYYYDSFAATTVLTDSYWGGCAAVNHLIGKGHRKIGYVGSIDVDNNALDRYYGYCRALRAASLEVRQDWVIADRTPEGFLDEFPLPAELPTAFFCNNDQSAYHFVQALLRKGYRIPEDISIIGFYDHVYATLLTPRLTTLRIDVGQMAREAVAALLLLCAPQGEPVPGRIVVSGRIVERDSVADRR